MAQVRTPIGPSDIFEARKPNARLAANKHAVLAADQGYLLFESQLANHRLHLLLDRRGNGLRSLLRDGLAGGLGQRGQAGNAHGPWARKTTCTLEILLAWGWVSFLVLAGVRSSCRPRSREKLPHNPSFVQGREMFCSKLVSSDLLR